MDYDFLTHRYWESQGQRVETLRNRIREREDAIAAGRVVPDGTDLALGRGRRIPMAVMFIDICGFSVCPSGTIAEQSAMLAALNLFFTEMIKIAEDYGGTVEKNTGDGLMAYFEDNGGTPPETGCKRSVACALTMMAAREYLISPVLEASGFSPFSFRISIDYGTVTVANLGVARGFNSYVAIGATANFAAKMLSNAGEQEIVIGQSVWQRLPLDWRVNYTQVDPKPTGWVHMLTGLPYLLYKYTGRWIRPTE
ncbi:adenylate/guanylate cyclase domain-containing protein [Burkholderia pseudomallei]|uniref:adenylate/guanylate cyclase domain-containing protein n=1 Tax=Burkholderia pseudomallei TaxID=28450 RepID=UPI001AD7E308|nr:adenylate/guanylate cyclase domain-containing protein [Burkholderia pseudomallei]MBO7754509.1 adenylate/guanylate cyclase domain-containing protein [Burkholderia pseudomallei]